MDDYKLGETAEKVVSDLQKDFKIVGSHRVHSWYAWAIVGIVFGMALGVVYVANRSGQFNAGQAETNLLGGLPWKDVPFDHEVVCSSVWPGSHSAEESGLGYFPSGHAPSVSAQCPPSSGSISGVTLRWSRSDPHPPKDHTLARSNTWPEEHAFAISNFWPPDHSENMSGNWPADHYIEQSATWPDEHLYFYSLSWRGDAGTWPANHDGGLSRQWPPAGTDSWPPNHHADASNKGEFPQ